MFFKTLISVFSNLMDKMPTQIILIALVIAQGFYITIDYYLIDLTPSIGTHYQQNLVNLEEKITTIHEECQKTINFLLLSRSSMPSDTTSFPGH